MKIAQINTVYKNGGSTGKIVYELSQAIQDNGWDSYVAYGYEYSMTTDANTLKMNSIAELKISILQTRLFAKHGFYNKRATHKLIKWLDELEPDIIHLHNLHNHYVNVEMLFNYIKEKNIPVVWTLHDCWSFTGWCAYFDYVNCDKWKKCCYACPNKRAYPFTWFFDKSLENFERKRALYSNLQNVTLVTPSRWLSNLTRQSFLKNYPVKVIHNGIDLEIFKPTSSNFRGEYSLSNKKVVLGVAMNLSKRKGIDYWIQLTHKLHELKYIVVLIGVPLKEQKLFEKHTLFLGKTNNQTELAKWYSLADVFVNPTLEDNYPTTNLEAIACGTPVVTIRTGGSGESVSNGTGVVVEKNDFQGLLSAIEKICNDEKINYVEQCRSKAEKDFSNVISSLQYTRLYKEVLGKT